MKHRVAVIGNAGSGKTTTARHLAAAGGLPIIDLDDLFWMPPSQYVTKRPVGQLSRIIEEKRQESSWIVEGVYGEPPEPEIEAALRRLIAYAEAYWTRDDLRSHSGHQRIFDEFGGAKVRLVSEDEVGVLLGGRSQLRLE